MKKPILLSILALSLFIFIHCSSNDLPAELLPETVTDADGNIYNTIKIGNQIWMLENLKTTTFNDGVAITEYTFGNDWYNANNPFAYYQWADTSDLNNQYDEELPFDFYGAMYNEVSIASGKLAPIGWRIPTEQDFIELQNFISNDGQADIEGTALKSSSGWLPAENNGTDIYGFNALPNGYVSSFGSATGAPVICSWATSNSNPSLQTRRIVTIIDSTIDFGDNSMLLGAGIRCIKE